MILVDNEKVKVTAEVRTFVDKLMYQADEETFYKSVTCTDLHALFKAIIDKFGRGEAAKIIELSSRLAFDERPLSDVINEVMKEDED